MGNDGGTIAKRNDILSLHRELQAKSKVTGIVDADEPPVCALTSLPLKDERIVGDFLGKLYRKEKILELILKSKLDQETAVKTKTEGEELPSSMNDIIDLKVSWNENILVCPVSGRKDLGYLRPCGCVVSHRLLKELRNEDTSNHESKAGTCPSCSVPFTFDYDIVLLEKSDSAREFNEKNYKTLVETLRVYHNKKPKKSKKRKDPSEVNPKKKKHKKHTTQVE